MSARSLLSIIGCIIALFILPIGSGAHAQLNTATAQKEKLAELQAELRARQQVLENNKASAQELENVLKKSELEIAKVAKALSTTRQALQNVEQEQSKLEEEQEGLKAAIRNQQSLLSSQLKSAFMAGHYDYAKMLFYQDDARTFERIITYYQYVAKARQEEIESFRSNVARLEEVNAELDEKAQSLLALREEQEGQRAVLITRQDDRKTTLKKINKTIASENQKIASLQADEQALKEAIEAAQIAAERAAREAEVSMNGLVKLKGKMSAPVKGRIRNLFGSRRQGQVSWKGIVIDGAEGDPVNSIAPGRVLYADWLRGFGLVAIVDHGEGYMSVYGHNQALLKQAGDDVRQGERIALVGRSGGQEYPNLYFEIRHKGKALNPRAWLD
ncbi:non-catalytic member of peptidase subfamily M23B [Alteromonas sp. KUL156]|uniref:murein hydrolase activator EnvC family protein n=1 Tax=Alteromonas sp. KUL106 TaxID=2480799 RepID=UPI0012E4A931|nr:peptidoglycan DD-metalloendopeptidase family protein [Alteromonas sp. KUL106]GFD69436.1 non-catalytic member of peptidase subfamily M23B [Alteromonas sp. KUL106]GFD80479.1 non-catalytic member of peptidase subfamily M23B [Tenacibaculum sp. KUL118]GFD94687.1 non-catalytic member of peptidase subfamily M23B [Alteromonas sp. KUL154]GFD98041.1 non-catalytic member of peptidase subfamily M23B [Alteromonas sp. KUL156]